jgi:hypothetical protein
VSRYWGFTLAGLAICGASLVAFDWGLYHLVRTGNCGSSSTFVSTRPCPPGTGLHIMSLVGGVFAALAGIGLYAARGQRGRPSPIGLGLLMWCLLFTTIAGSVAYAAYGPASAGDSGAHGVAIILGVIFLPMGLLPLLFPLFGRGRNKKALQLVQHGSRCAGEVVSVEDTNVTINDNPRVKMTIRAEPPGEPPFTIVKTATVSRVNIPRRGDRCTVFYDPADRENRNGITFDTVPGFTPYVTTGQPFPTAPIATPTPASAPAPQAPAAAPIPGFSSPGAAATDDDPDEDPLVKIERLGKLRERGLVTQAEFDEQKRRLLGEL